jgi:hypothetical protein
VSDLNTMNYATTIIAASAANWQPPTPPDQEGQVKLQDLMLLFP